jgi:hypothetical protein
MSIAATAVVLTATWGGTEYEWGSSIIVGLGVATVVLGALFVIVERRTSEPALPLRLFRLRTFNVAGGVSLIVGVAMFGSITYLPTFLQVANGASASNSGLLLVPLMLGLLTASMIAGQITSRTGRYRIFPILGMAIAALGVFMLSTLDTGSTRWESGTYMVLLGAGIGLTMQTMVLATQNEAPAEDLGVATSTITFFRAVGGSVGVALFGALFSSRLGELLGGSAPTGLTPEEIAHLPAAEQARMAGAFADAITSVFLYAVPVLLVGFLLTHLLRENPLRTVSGSVRRADEVRAAAGTPEEAAVGAGPVNGNGNGHGTAPGVNGSGGNGHAPAVQAVGHAGVVDYGATGAAPTGNGSSPHGSTGGR